MSYQEILGEKPLRSPIDHYRFIFFSFINFLSPFYRVGSLMEIPVSISFSTLGSRPNDQQHTTSMDASWDPFATSPVSKRVETAGTSSICPMAVFLPCHALLRTAGALSNCGKDIPAQPRTGSPSRSNRRHIHPLSRCNWDSVSKTRGLTAER